MVATSGPAMSDPSPNEIRQLCAAIRSGWSVEERIRRRMATGADLPSDFAAVIRRAQDRLAETLESQREAGTPQVENTDIVNVDLEFVYKCRQNH